MSDDADKESKSEQPTEKKIDDTLEKGNVPFSKEVTNAFSLISMIIVGYLYLPKMVTELSGVLKSVFANVNNWPLDRPEDASLLQNLLGAKIIFSLAPIILPIVLFGLVSSLSQNMPKLIVNRIQPKLERISPAKGLKRLLGRQGFREFSKALFKFSAAGAVSTFVVLSQSEFVVSRILIDTVEIPFITHQIFLQALLSLTLTISVLGVLDFIWVRKDWIDDLKMTHQEVKDERKQSEGDPMVKMRSRSVAQDRARRRMISKVADATLVVANPVHFAIAMRYEPEVDKVPVVLAKGPDLIAIKIREVAEQCGIPVIEDPPLAQALYKVVEVDMEIPIEFYVPIAQIIRALTKPRSATHR